MLKERIASINDNPFTFTGWEKIVKRLGVDRLFVCVQQTNSQGGQNSSWVPFDILEPSEAAEHTKHKRT
jgi:hypothetical protein